MADRIARVQIRNVRAIESLDLDVSAMTVLIGENGAGKSTIIECLELLHRAPEANFLSLFYSLHRGMPGLLRKGATSLALGVVVEDDEGKLPRLEYVFALAKQAAGATIVAETLFAGPTDDANAGLAVRPEVDALTAQLAEHRRVLSTTQSVTRGGQERDKARLRAKAAVREASVALADLEAKRSAAQSDPLPVIMRSIDAGWIFDAASRVNQLAPIKADRLTIANVGDPAPHPAIDRLVTALRGIEVHLDMDARASWAMRQLQRPESLRGATTHFPADRLTLLGANLANAWSALLGREGEHRERTLACVRVGLGEDVDTVVVTPDPGGGNIYLAVRWKGLVDPVLATDLSDGQLAWLAFVAMVRLNDARSFLVIDEPELHLHPQLLGGVLELLKGVAAPVLIATHSDRVLELLDDPAGALRVCGLESGGRPGQFPRAVVSRVDAKELPKWLAQYGDFGKVRAAGYLSRVLAPPEGT